MGHGRSGHCLGGPHDQTARHPSFALRVRMWRSPSARRCRFRVRRLPFAERRRRGDLDSCAGRLDGRTVPDLPRLAAKKRKPVPDREPGVRVRRSRCRDVRVVDVRRREPVGLEHTGGVQLALASICRSQRRERLPQAWARRSPGPSGGGGHHRPTHAASARSRTPAKRGPSRPWRPRRRSRRERTASLASQSRRDHLDWVASARHHSHAP